jgi:hypothetical protein
MNFRHNFIAYNIILFLNLYVTWFLLHQDKKGTSSKAKCQSKVPRSWKTYGQGLRVAPPILAARSISPKTLGVTIQPAYKLEEYHVPGYGQPVDEGDTRRQSSVAIFAP